MEKIVGNLGEEKLKPCIKELRNALNEICCAVDERETNIEKLIVSCLLIKMQSTELMDNVIYTLIAYRQVNCVMLYISVGNVIYSLTEYRKSIYTRYVLQERREEVILV